jgi:16S rRNA G1207 methylase RsmC
MSTEKLTRVTIALPVGCSIQVVTTKRGGWPSADRFFSEVRSFSEIRSAARTGVITIEIPDDQLTAMREVARKLLEDLT